MTASLHYSFIIRDAVLIYPYKAKSPQTSDVCDDDGADDLVVIRCTRQAYPVGMPCPRFAIPPLPTAQARRGPRF